MAATGKMQLQKTEEGSLTVALAGSWKLGQELPSADEVLHALEDMPEIGSIVFNTRELAEWDSGLLIFLKQLSEFSAQKKITIEESGLPEGARKLLALAAGRCRFSPTWATKPSISSRRQATCWLLSVIR